MGLLGLASLAVTARIAMRNSELTDIEFMALVGRGRGWLYNEGLLSGNMWAWWAICLTVNSDQFEQRVRLDKELARENAIRPGHQVEAGSGGIIVNKPSLDIGGSGEGLEIYLSPAATSENRSVAFH